MQRAKRIRLLWGTDSRRGRLVPGGFLVWGVALFGLSLVWGGTGPFGRGQGSRGGDIVFAPVFNGQVLENGRAYPLEGGDSIQVEVLRFYVSRLRFLRKGKVVFVLPEKYHLIDRSDSASLSVAWASHKALSFDALAFELGVDSLTQAVGVHGDALDPVHGMYWSWQSGYIHVKIEGKASAVRVRNGAFQYHLGGYRAPYNTIRTVVLPASPQPEIRIQVSLDTFFAQMDLSGSPEIMRPSAGAMQAVRYFADAFNTVPR